jgi:hypothetical protein
MEGRRSYFVMNPPWVMQLPERVAFQAASSSNNIGLIDPNLPGIQLNVWLTWIPYQI